MVQLTLLLILIQILLLRLSLTIAQPPFTELSCTGNSTIAFHKNLDKVFTTISSNTEIGNNGFINISEGQPPNKVYLMATCRGDLSSADCHSCINNSTSRFQQACLTNNESIGFYQNNCMLRYSYRPIFGLYEFAPNCSWWSLTSLPDPYKTKFRLKVRELFSELINKTAAGDSRKKFATGVVNVSASLKAYALTQCTPDLSTADCSACLQRNIGALNLCCFNFTGRGISLPSCAAEFQNYKFYQEAENISTSSVILPSSVSHSRKLPGKNTYIICGIGFSLLIIVSLIYIFSRRKSGPQVGENDQIRCLDYKEFDFDTIVAATDDFSNSKRLGIENTEAIFKGILPSGQEIAVKRLEKYGKDAKYEFNNEIYLLTNVQHINVVKLLGFCIQDKLRILIYEFLCNESLDLFLCDSMKRKKLEWETRHNIIHGIARGLHYLHEDSQLRIIHRDIKASNILLSSQMKPKISNFIKASHVRIDQTRRGDSIVIKGTYGYMPPEYMEHGQYSVKSDVFSFGVLLLEILSGQLSIFSKEKNEVDLLCNAWRKWSERRALDVVDPTLQRIKSHTTAILRCFKIALLCVQVDPTCRPTMATIMFMLNNDMVLIEEPSKPGFCNQSW